MSSISRPADELPRPGQAQPTSIHLPQYDRIKPPKPEEAKKIGGESDDDTSDDDDDTHERKKADLKPAPKKIWGMEVKAQTTVWNMMALVTTSCGVATGLSFYNTQSVYLLIDPMYFDISDKKARNIQLASQMAAATLWATLFTPFMGQLYEVIGRRAVISINYALMIFFIWLTPYSATILSTGASLPILKFCRVVVTVCSTFLLTSPLTVDYIKSEAQGKGSSVNEVGATIGAFIGMSLLVNLCDEWDQKQSFGLCAAVMAVITSLSMFWIRNAPRKTPLAVGVALAVTEAAKEAKKSGEPSAAAVAADQEKGKDDDFKKAEENEKAVKDSLHGLLKAGIVSSAKDGEDGKAGGHKKPRHEPRTASAKKTADAEKIAELTEKTMNPEQLQRKEELTKKNAEKQKEFAARAADIKSKRKRAMDDAFKGIASGAVEDNPEFRQRKKEIMKMFDIMEKQLKHDKLEWSVKHTKRESEFAQSVLQAKINSKNCWQTFVHLTKRVYATSRTDVKYPFCFFATIPLQVMPIIYQNYVLGYINTFVDDGPMCVCDDPCLLEEQQFDAWGRSAQVCVDWDLAPCADFVSPCIIDGTEASAIHADFIMNNTAVQLLILPYAGMMADSLEPYTALPVAFATRGALALLFLYFINSPTGDWYIFMSCGLNAASTFELTIVTALFNRNLPSDIRAGMTAAFNFSGSFFKIFLTMTLAAVFDASLVNDKSVYWGLVAADGILLSTSLILGWLGYLKAPEPKVMPKPKKVIKDSEDEYEDDGFFADTQIDNGPVTKDGGPVIFAAKDAAGQAGQLARSTLLDLAGDAVTGGNKNIFSVARKKGDPKVLPITDHNVFNCEEKILESADQHEKELDEKYKNADFEQIELQRDMQQKYDDGYKAGLEAAKGGSSAKY